jgi:hypothetical protein
MRNVNRHAPTRVLVALAVGLSMFLASGVCLADAPAHDIWMISTRKAPSSNPVGGEGRMNYWRLDEDRHWASSDEEAFLAADDPAVPTSVFIHGNRTDRNWAVRTGWGVYQKLKPLAGERPLRFVIWSWPADQIGGVRQDVQVKARRSDVQAYYLAYLLRKMDPDVRVSMIGYSFGARTITGALQLLGGGKFGGYGLPDLDAPVTRTPVRAVLVAAAMPNYWLSPGRSNGLALAQADRVLVTRNRYDPVLQWYDRMYGRGGPQALGYTGPSSFSRLGEQRERVEVLGVERSVGNNHDWNGYLNASPLRSRLAWYTFLEPTGEQPIGGN